MAETLVEVQKQEVHGHEHDHHDQGFVSKYIFSTDHKIIAMQRLWQLALWKILLLFIFYLIYGPKLRSSPAPTLKIE